KKVLQNQNREISNQKTELESIREELEACVLRRTAQLEESNRQLRENEARYRLLHETAFDGIIIADEDGRIIDCNPSAHEIFGCKETMPPNTRLIDLMPESYRERHVAGFTHFLKTGESRIQGRVVEVEGLRMDKTVFPLELIVKSFRVNDKTYFSGTIRDITEKKQAELENARIQAQLYHSQKMEAVGVLAGGVAHDFNNLLTTIRGYSDLLSMDDKLSEETRSDIDEIKKAAEKASSLTRQLLAFSRRQMFQPEWLDLNEIVASMDKMLSRLIGEDVQMITVPGNNLGNIKADKGQMEQVIMNLVVNARDAMPEGGTLTITTDEVTITEDDCQAFSYYRPGTFVRLTVEDSGAGMDADTVKMIFEPFFTTKETGRGTGLGLAVVYGIIKQHQGWINVYSEPGHGSTFKVYLPSFPDAEKEDIMEKINVEDLQGNGERILLVEDEEGVRQFAVRILLQNGYQAISAATIRDAVEIYQKESDTIHLLCSDVVLPDGRGVELAEQLTSRTPQLPVVLSSGYTRQRSQDQHIRDKGFLFLQKPYTMIELLAAIKEAFALQASPPCSGPGKP
ncbi:MAG: PAS domain S-box protein, partial [Nitrospirota bacterium]|nr:PAS domain S-box protein [Nitrospirota bacterium]